MSILESLASSPTIVFARQYVVNQIAGLLNDKGTKGVYKKLKKKINELEHVYI